MINFFDSKKRNKRKRIIKEKIENREKLWKKYFANLGLSVDFIEKIIKFHYLGINESDLRSQFKLNMLKNDLLNYSESLAPWARRVSLSMLDEVNLNEKSEWIKHSRNIGTNIKREIEKTPIGDIYLTSMAEQVGLITSLPNTAYHRIHELINNQIYTGSRGHELMSEILKTGEVTRSRAKLIARTETSRASAELTRARATYIGSPGYIWRTSKDFNVRLSHKELEGTLQRWEFPPVCDPPNHRAHPGSIWNCRCYAEVVIPIE